MYAERRYGYWMTIKWSIKGLYFGIATSILAVTLYELAHQRWMAIPWQPVALVGTALAFYLGFKNNASYDRLWEARKIWGAILNNSRSFGAAVLGYVSNLHAYKSCPSCQKNSLMKPPLYSVRHHRRRNLAFLTAHRRIPNF